MGRFASCEGMHKLAGKAKHACMYPVNSSPLVLGFEGLRCPA